MARAYDEESGLSPQRRLACLRIRIINKLPAFVAILFIVLCLALYTSNTTTTDYLPSKSSSKKPLTVIISAAEFQIPEVDFWIHALLPRLGRRLDVQVVNSDTRKPLKVMDDSLIIAFQDMERFRDSVWNSHLKNVGLLRIGDEHGKDSLDAYAGFSYVFRPYYFPSINNPPPSEAPSSLLRRPVWIPNGWSIGVGPRAPHTLLSFHERDTLCFFAGSPRDSESLASRENMRVGLMHWDSLQSLRGVEKRTRIACDVQWTPGFMGGEKPLVYSTRLGRAKYALCPAGESPETIRLYEALENDAIPIVIYEPWMVGAFGSSEPNDYPFIVLKEWNDIGATLERIAKEPNEVGLARQGASRKWWEDLQVKVGKNAKEAVDKAFKAKYHGAA